MSVLPRMHLVEFHELEAAPEALRDGIVEILSRTLRWGGLLDGLIEPFERFVRDAGVDEVLDLCAGAGGPAQILVDKMLGMGARPPKILMTDLFPRVQLWRDARARHPEHLDFVSDSVDATNIDPRVSRGRGRMVINAFHHFAPELAGAILRDAVASRAPILIVESFERNPLGFLPFAPAGLPALLLNPLLSGRQRAAKALMTYVVPIIPLVSIWDGLVSTMRVYTEDELRQLAGAVPGAQDFEWSFGTYPCGVGGTGTWFSGTPRD